MIEFEEITQEEIRIYTTQLVTRLLRVPPYQWTRIDSIAKDVARFIDICQHLANRGYFCDADGWLILDISQDSLVRLDPMYIRKCNTKTFKIWK